MNSFYNKIYKFIFADSDVIDDLLSTDEFLSTDEADAILHYIITLSEVVRSTYHKPIQLEKKAIILIDRYNASISSEYGFSQNCQIYSKQYIGCEKVIYDAKIDPGICVQKFDRYHMIKDGTIVWLNNQSIPDRILKHSLIHDPRIKTNQECLDKISKLNMVKNNDLYKELIEKLSQDNLVQKNNDQQLKRKNTCIDDLPLDQSNKHPKDDK